MEEPSEPVLDLTAFEKRVLDEMSPLFGAEEHAYLRQVQTAKVRDRKNTFVGFYTRVDVDRLACQPIVFEPHPIGAWFEVEGVEDGVGILLWADAGYIETIEGFTANADGLGGQQLADLRYLSLIKLG